jgi:hypothetical protein
MEAVMTEPSFNEDAASFWAMTDEAWISYRRWLSGESAERDLTTLKDLDFQPLCDSCGEHPAVSYVHWHPVGRCNLFQNRRQELLVCDRCLADFEDKSILITAEVQAWTWILPRKRAVCPTCGRDVQVASDVLQFVRGLK